MLIGGTLNRMILTELVKVFLLALTGLTGLFLLVGSIPQAISMGLSLGQVIAVTPLFIPSTLPYTIPATTLFASCVVYGRLAHDNEVVAVRAAGVHLFTLLKPALILGLLATAATGGLCYSVIAVSQQRLQESLLKDPEEVLYNYLRRDRCLRAPNSPFVLYVRDVQGRRLVDVVLKQRRKVKDAQTGAEITTGTGYELVARAGYARLRVDAAEGKLYIDPDRFVIYNPTTQGATASNGPLPVDLPTDLNAKDARTRPMSMSWTDLTPRIETLRQEQDELKVKQAESREKAVTVTDPEVRKVYQAEDGFYRSQIENQTRQVRNVEAEFYSRPALAFGCLVFALVGCPVGIWANRADYLSTFVICFLPMVLVYYPLLIGGTNMGKDGKLPLGLGCWVANILFGTTGLALTWRLLRR